jgi:hypothetical protein
MSSSQNSHPTRKILEIKSHFLQYHVASGNEIMELDSLESIPSLGENQSCLEVLFD